ncbi:response regulator transcription factor [Oceanirhabdus sp. W0125-5]|uniref:response regulator transcription factor n=1 Tax=Oceanirhabdus sp. W0125-5 TaxID=2999116 RepID=UPI0022F2ECDC|nr:response regulator transcription factor [Oceanirhabdus sp. W0125-5]WBW96869.1 response regulator transcription factor [Oceanirhabdus sp. W0125-5]
MYRILVVEDDKNLCEEVILSLKKWGYDAFGVDNFSEIDKEFLEQKPHLVLMDINLPSFDGFYWCRKIRELSKLPIIFMSSRDTNMDVVMAINMGGDDFVTKPFVIDILVAKIIAQLRRCYSYGESMKETIEHRGAILNISEGTLVYKEEKIELTRNELKILGLLLKSKGTIISRDKIMKALWDDDQFINDNTLTVNINRLRGKLKDAGLDEFIQTKKGLGYVVQ